MGPPKGIVKKRKQKRDYPTMQSQSMPTTPNLENRQHSDASDSDYGFNDNWI
jgi:hypothetical protein